ncbi:MAG: hypothetical protein H7Z71_08235 [Moraxellaceae bacterium]|nr:hypothetical protein [Pseudobdellovibrionaceae bacterium]
MNKIFFVLLIFIWSCNPLKSGSLPLSAGSASVLDSSGSGLIDKKNRQDVIQAFNNWYLKPSVNLDFNGNVALCNAGTTSIEFQQSVIDRINFYRALAGLNSAVLFANQFKNNKAALIMDANHSLSHNPPSNWICYSAEGAAGASSSNLTLGVMGRKAIDMYMDDPGGANSPAGHRRWILYPPQSKFSTGDTPNSNSLGVFFTANNSVPAGLKFVAWPSAGFYPIELMPTSKRWSFSSVTLGNIAQAAVSMKNMTTGQNVPIVMEPYYPGYGSETLVWRAEGVSAATILQETTFQITVSNINDAGVMKSYSYSVIAFHVN